MKIIGYSDVITNSSSEVFVIKPQDGIDSEELLAEIDDFIQSLCDSMGYNDSGLYSCVAGQNYKDSYFCNYNYSSGDILIHSNDDNSIPWKLMDIITDLDCIPKFENKIKKLSRTHLG